MEKIIQENAKIIRNILGYNQTQMATILGVTRQHLGNIENGKTKVERPFAILFIMIVKHASESLDRDSLKYRLIRIYMDEFDDFIRKLIYLNGAELI